MHKQREEIAVSFELPEASWRAEDWGELHVSFETYREAFDDRPILRGLPGDHCRCPHWGYVLKGKLHVFYADHEEDVAAGNAYYLPPGHAIAVEPGTELIEFSPRDAFAAHMKAVEENLARR